MDAMEDTQQTENPVAATEEKVSSGQQEQAAVTDDNMSDEAKLAAEALAATDEPAGKSPEIESLKSVNDQLLNSITARRHLLRELDKKTAERMEAERPVLPPEKSPEEKYVEENKEIFDPDTTPFPAKVQMAQRKFEKEQAEKDRKRQEESTINNRAKISSVEARRKYSDFDKILSNAQDVLTEGDQVDLRRAIEEGKDGAEFLYKRCIYKTLEAGGDRAKQLRAELKAKVPAKASVQKQQSKQSTDGSELRAGQKQEKTPAPPANPELGKNPTLAHVYAAFGVDE